MILGFDFDKVFINYPPFLPYSLVDFLYKGSLVFKKRKAKNIEIHYRTPGNFEKKIRVASHFPMFRAPIKRNIHALKKISEQKTGKIYLVSSRFSFLKKRTDVVLKNYRLHDYFDEVHFNYSDKQPHLFKEQTIKKLKIDTYVDDDLDLALYLASKIPTLTIYWVTDSKEKINLPKNIIPIKDLSVLAKKILKK